MPTYSLSVQPYLDQYNKCYKKIVVINANPHGILSKYVKRINPPKLSSFKQDSPCCSNKKCIFVICDINDNCLDKFLSLDDIPNLFSFLITNGYTIDSKLTELMQNSKVKLSNDLLCFISI